MEREQKVKDHRAILLLSSLAAIVGGLCCLTPIVLVLLGLATVSAAASLGNVLYGDYGWLFRLLALICVGLGLIVYFRRSGVCSLEVAKRERNRLINVSLIVVIVSIGAYVFWTYAVLHYWGILAGLPWAQYDESWATPVAGALFVGAVLLAAILRRATQAEIPTLLNLLKSRDRPPAQGVKPKVNQPGTRCNEPERGQSLVERLFLGRASCARRRTARCPEVSPG